ncbi:MAG: ATP-binding protein [Blastocatellia bacterium]
MSDSNSRQILSRLSDEEFVDRDVEVAKVCATGSISSHGTLTNRDRTASIALLLGPPHAGKTAILRKSFDRLFNEGGEVIPIYYALRVPTLEPDEFARDYFAQFLAQFIAFRRNDPGLISVADEPLTVIAQAAPPEDYLWVKTMLDSLTRASQSGDMSLLIRCALLLPAAAEARTSLRPLVMIDNWHLIAGTGLQGAFNRVWPNSVAYVLCGLRRLTPQLIPADPEVFDRIETIRVGNVDEKAFETFIRRQADAMGVEINDSTVELMIQQLDRDFFYTGAIIAAAASRSASLKTFIEFERLYAAEILGGRIGHYLDSVLRDATKDSSSGRAPLEALALVIEARRPVPIDAVIERIAEHTADAEALLGRMHARELLEMSSGFVNAPEDAVLSDYVRAKYRSEILGEKRPVSGEELLTEKLKHSYRLMMSRYNRAIESQLVELVSRFDFQSVPASLFDHAAYAKRYRGMSRVQIRRSLDEETESVRLPQIAIVHNAGAAEQPGVNWQLFTATGFEGGIYTEANEVLWLIGLINSKKPLDVETLIRIDQQLESAMRGHIAKTGTTPNTVRWYISKEGFSAIASERLSKVHAHSSTYSHLDLIQDHLTGLALEGEARPASEFELVIPIEDEAELIAARTAEQIARAADFDQEAINQIKTALIEACINAAEHSDSPDRKIHQHFAIDDDKLIITVSNKGKTMGRANAQSSPSVAAPPAKGTRGRGLHIIRALMDEVELERTDDGVRLVMTKYLKRPDGQ